MHFMTWYTNSLYIFLQRQSEQISQRTRFGVNLQFKIKIKVPQSKFCTQDP